MFPPPWNDPGLSVVDLNPYMVLNIAFFELPTRNEPAAAHPKSDWSMPSLSRLSLRPNERVDVSDSSRNSRSDLIAESIAVTSTHSRRGPQRPPTIRSNYAEHDEAIVPTTSGAPDRQSAVRSDRQARMSDNQPPQASHTLSFPSRKLQSLMGSTYKYPIISPSTEVRSEFRERLDTIHRFGEQTERQFKDHASFKGKDPVKLPDAAESSMSGFVSKRNTPSDIDSSSSEIIFERESVEASDDLLESDGQGTTKNGGHGDRSTSQKTKRVNEARKAKKRGYQKKLKAKKKGIKTTEVASSHAAGLLI